MPHALRKPNFTNRAQCTANSKTRVDAEGKPERCRKQAILGGFVCRFHGGNAPHVKEAAQQRLFDMVAPAIKRLFDLAMQTKDLKVASHCVVDILNRAGVGEAVQARIRASHGKSDEPRTVVNIGFLQMPEAPAAKPGPLTLEAVFTDQEEEPL